MRVTFSKDELDTLKRALDFVCDELDGATKFSAIHTFALRLTRSKVGALRAKIFPTNTETK